MSRYEKRRRVIVRFSAGPTWISGPPEDQPEWDAHVRFVDDLIERGIMVLGGPFGDNSGSTVVYEGVSADEARRLVERDPFLHNGVFVLEDVREWRIYVDELTR